MRRNRSGGIADGSGRQWKVLGGAAVLAVGEIRAVGPLRRLEVWTLWGGEFPAEASA